MLKNLSKEAILFVDDDKLWLENTIRGLKILGLKGVEGCSNPLDVLDLLKLKNYTLVAIDLWMPQKPGEVLLSEIKQHYPNLPVIVITADNQIDKAVNCMRNGATNYLNKPIEPNQVIAHIRQIIENRKLEEENIGLSDQINQGNLESPINYYATLSQTVVMQKIFDHIDTFSQSILPILIIGEVGTGKQQLATSIHKAHKRSGKFIVIDISTLDDPATFFSSNSIDSFKYITHEQIGITVYIKNIDLLDFNSQESLLVLLQEIQDQYHNTVISINEFPRIIFSSTKNILDDIDLHPDLNFILKIQKIFLPPLRERKIDISLLATYFIDQFVNSHNINTPHVPKELLPLLEQYTFPENIKELKEMFDDALSKCNRGKLSLESFKDHMEKQRSSDIFSPSNSIFSNCEVLPTLKDSQYYLILEALKRTDGNQAHAAHLLGITRQGLNKKIQALNITPE